MKGIFDVPDRMTNNALPAGGGGGLPPFDFSSRSWRDRSIKGKEHIPVGYTYFGQLIGHDLGNSTPLANAPFVRDSGDTHDYADADWARRRHNLIENPLTLETVYGPGPMMLPHLYDPNTFLFRVKPGAIISQPYRAPGPQGRNIQSVRALYDGRNRDTTILHRLTVIWMKFHNRVALEIEPPLGRGGAFDKPTKLNAYAQARSHVLSIWHRLIRTEFLEIFCDPDVMAMTDRQMDPFAVIDEATLLHGVFRTFHALPRSEYRFTQRHRSLREFLLGRPDNDEKVSSSWKLDWRLFFHDLANGVPADGTKTGLCASCSPDLMARGALVLDLDVITAQTTDPLTLASPEMTALVARLPAPWAAQLAPDALAQRLSAEIGQEVPAPALGNCPLFFVLMLEAQFHGREGRFGPLGSILLRRAIETAMSRTVFRAPAPGLPTHLNPGSMLELISATPI